MARAPLDGGVADTLATFITDIGGSADAVGGLAVDSTSVYLSRNDILKLSIDGGPTTTLASNEYPVGPVADSANVYWNSFTSTGYSVKSVAKAGGPERTLASGAVSVLGGQYIAADGASVYFSILNGDSGRIMKVATSGGPVTTLVCSLDSPGPFVVDETSIYWVTQGGAVMKTAKN